MVGTFPQGIPSQFAGEIIQVTSKHIGQCLVESISKQFPRKKTQRGDFYVDLTYSLLDANLSLINPCEKRTIQRMMEELMQEREVLEIEGDSRLEKFLKARKFKELSKALYIVTKKASDRGKGESLLAQIKRATGATEMNDHNPFSDPPSAQLFADSSTHLLESVEMTTLRSSTTGDEAVRLTLRGQGVPREDVIGVFANDRVDYGAINQSVTAIDGEQDPWAPQGAN